MNQSIGVTQNTKAEGTRDGEMAHPQHAEDLSKPPHRPNQPLREVNLNDASHFTAGHGETPDIDCFSLALCCRLFDIMIPRDMVFSNFSRPGTASMGIRLSITYSIVEGANMCILYG